MGEVGVGVSLDWGVTAPRSEWAGGQSRRQDARSQANTGGQVGIRMTYQRQHHQHPSVTLQPTSSGELGIFFAHYGSSALGTQYLLNERTSACLSRHCVECFIETIP